MALPQLLNRLEEVVPSGFIGMWSGSANTIPTGWALCDGANGTPNLTDRFVLGAGKAYQPGATWRRSNGYPQRRRRKRQNRRQPQHRRARRDGWQGNNRDRRPERRPLHLDRSRRDRDRHSGHDAGWEYPAEPWPYIFWRLPNDTGQPRSGHYKNCL